MVSCMLNPVPWVNWFRGASTSNGLLNCVGNPTAGAPQKTPRHNGKELFKGINLSVPQGKLVALTGPAGSGKSRLLNMLAGEVEPTSGQVLVPSHLRFVLVTHQVFVRLGLFWEPCGSKQSLVKLFVCFCFFLPAV